MSNFIHKHLQCACESPDHVIRVTLDNTDKIPEMSLHAIMNPELGIFRRLFVAFCYVFGIVLPEKHWGSSSFISVILSEKGVRDLTGMLIRRKILIKLNKK